MGRPPGPRGLAVRRPDRWGWWPGGHHRTARSIGRTRRGSGPRPEQGVGPGGAAPPRRPSRRSRRGGGRRPPIRVGSGQPSRRWMAGPRLLRPESLYRVGTGPTARPAKNRERPPRRRPPATAPTGAPMRRQAARRPPGPGTVRRDVGRSPSPQVAGQRGHRLGSGSHAGRHTNSPVVGSGHHNARYLVVELFRRFGHPGPVSGSELG